MVGLRRRGRGRPARRPAAEVAPALREWSVDDDLWKRRASIIAQVRRKRETDFALLTDCIEPNRADREFFIRKAIGWALRAYAWVEPETVRAYCDTHELSPLSRREALKHVQTTVITLRRMAAYLRAHGVDAWADYIEALRPTGPRRARSRAPRPRSGTPTRSARGPTAGASCASNSRTSRRTSCR